MKYIQKKPKSLETNEQSIQLKNESRIRTGDLNKPYQSLMHHADKQ